MEDTKQEELLTRKEMCEALKISDKTLASYLKNELFPRIVMPGGEYRFLRSEVLAFLRGKGYEQ